MKNAFKKISNIFFSLTFIFSSIICMFGALGAKAPSASPSFNSKALKASNSSLRQTEISDSLFLVDLNQVKVSGNNIFVYDNKDSTIKIIDKITNTYRSINNHYRFYNLKDFIIYNDVLLLFNGEENQFTCIDSNTFENVNFDSQTNLTTKNSAKTIKIVSVNSKDYLLLCPTDPTLGYFELAEISLSEQNISGTKTEKVLLIENVSTFKIAESWAVNNVLNSYNQIFVTEIESELFIMLLTNNELYSFFVNPNNILSTPYSTITSVSGLSNVDNIIDMAQIKVDGNSSLLITYENKICFYDLNIIKNISATLTKKDLEISFNEFNITSIDANLETIVLISNQNQSIKAISLESLNNNGYITQNVVNEQISPFIWANSSFKYANVLQNVELLNTPYSKEPIINIDNNSNVVIVGEGRYLSGEQIYGYNYVMYTVNNQNYFGYVNSLYLNLLTETTYEKQYITVLGYTKLYLYPSKFIDNTNIEIKTIANSSRLEVLTSLCDYSAMNTSYLLVKVNGNEIGFIDKSRVLASNGVNDKIIPNATIIRNDSEVFTSTDEDKEVIIRLNKGCRVKVIGKRDTITNYTKICFNDSEGNEYTGYVYTHNLQPDSWSTLQIIGMFLVVLNVIMLVIIVCIKNKVTR